MSPNRENELSHSPLLWNIPGISPRNHQISYLYYTQFQPNIQRTYCKFFANLLIYERFFIIISCRFIPCIRLRCTSILNKSFNRICYHNGEFLYHLFCHCLTAPSSPIPSHSIPQHRACCNHYHGIFYT